MFFPSRTLIQSILQCTERKMAFASAQASAYWTTFPAGAVSLRRAALRPIPGRLLD